MIEGVKIINLKTLEDDRGYLIEVIRKLGEEEHAVCHEFGQVYVVGDPVRGIIRAFHKHDQLWDWFFIVHGSAKFVLKDDRKEKKTYNEMMQVIASSRNPKLIVVPPGVYHGWMSLEDDTILISIASHTYNREKPDEIRIPPDSFGDVWTVKGR